MNLETYITQNWKTLPKSYFEEVEVVIFQCDEDENYGHGHHSYAGWGVDIDGNVLWCYSSGCSCAGSTGADTTKDVKTLIADKKIPDIDYNEIDFDELVVNFEDY